MSDTCTNEVVLNKIDTHFTEMVNARDLYDQLQINKVFRAWIRQNIDSLGLVENVDYVKFGDPCEDVKKTGSGGHNIIHYGLTYATALIIAAKRKGPIGIQMLQHIKTIINNQTTLYIEYKDKHDLYMGGDYEYTIADTAKMFGIPGFGQNKFKSWLRTEGYILSNDTPAQKEVSAGHMRLIFKEIPNGNEVPVILISKQGVDFYSKKLGMIRVSYLNYEKAQEDAAVYILNM
jgi:phage anti-repressor protein